jgi:superfamily II DNA helicase RecQ
MPLLSVGADQDSKISTRVENINERQQRIGSIVSIHLDEVKHVATQRKLATALLSLNDDTAMTVFLFASPQAILKKEWDSVLGKLARRKLIRLICLDEVHLYVNFGLTFRHDFLKLKNTLFEWVRTQPLSHGSNSLLRIPLLLMTATWNLELELIFSLMTGVRPQQNLYVWASAKEMQRRQNRITMIAGQKKGSKIQSHCIQLFGTSEDGTAVVYSNSRKAVEKIAIALNQFLDHEDLHYDTVVVNGEMFAEQKFFYTRLFTKNSATGRDGDGDDTSGNGVYNPRVLIATAGAAGVGIDSPEVHLVLRDGFPPSILSLVQELGRAGRGENASPDTDKCVVIVSLYDYLYLLKRIHENNDTNSDKKGNNVIPRKQVVQMEVDALNRLTSVLCLDNGCVNVAIERMTSSPSDENKNEPIAPCMNACPHCTREFHHIFPPVKREGVIKFLVDNILRNSQGDRTAAELVSLLMNYKDVGQAVYSRPRSNKSPDSTTVGLTVLQWIAAGIIDAYVKENSEGKKEVYIRAGCDDEAMFHFNDNSRWEKILTVS